MSAIADKKRGAAQRGSETGAQGDRAAADEITSDTVLLLGADDGVEIDIIADQFADLLGGISWIRSSWASCWACRCVRR